MGIAGASDGGGFTPLEVLLARRDIKGMRKYEDVKRKGDNSPVDPLDPRMWERREAEGRVGGKRATC